MHQQTTHPCVSLVLCQFTLQIYTHWRLRTKRLIPPEDERDPIQTCECQRRQLQLSKVEPLNSSRNALHNKPGRLEYKDELREPIPLRPVRDLVFCYSDLEIRVFYQFSEHL